MNLRRLAAASAALTLFAPLARADHAWGDYHWERNSSAELVKELGDNVTTAAWSFALQNASADWSASTVLDAPTRPGTAKNAKRCSPASGQIEVCNDTYGNNGWLGLASISVSGSHITAGYAKMNDTYFNDPTYDSTAWRAVVMCQEVGHLWGLSHNDEDFSTTNGTCMDYSYDPVPNQHPNQHDYDMLLQIYNHIDTSGGGGGGGGGCNPRSPFCNGNADVGARVLSELALDGPRQWGRLVSGHGPIEVFELDLGAGNRIVTTVTWTLDRAYGPHDDH